MNLTEEVEKKIKSAMEVSLYEAMKNLGPIPDEFTERIKEIIARDTSLAFIALASVLESCMNKGGSLFLTDNIDSIKAGEK